MTNCTWPASIASVLLVYEQHAVPAAWLCSKASIKQLVRILKRNGSSYWGGTARASSVEVGPLGAQDKVMGRKQNSKEKEMKACERVGN